MDHPDKWRRRVDSLSLLLHVHVAESLEEQLRFERRRDGKGRPPSATHGNGPVPDIPPQWSIAITVDESAEVPEWSIALLDEAAWGWTDPSLRVLMDKLFKRIEAQNPVPVSLEAALVQSMPAEPPPADDEQPVVVRRRALRPRLTEAQRSDVLARKAAGQTRGEIATALGIHRKTVDRVRAEPGAEKAVTALDVEGEIASLIEDAEAMQAQLRERIVKTEALLSGLNARIGGYRTTLHDLRLFRQRKDQQEKGTEHEEGEN